MISELYIAGVLVFSFSWFAFVAEQANPFKKPRNSVRRARWRYGRRVGVASLFFGICALVVMQYTQISTPVALASCAALFTICWILISRHMQGKRLLMPKMNSTHGSHRRN